MTRDARVPQVGAIIWYYDNSVVLRRNNRGRWMFPHGAIRPGETAMETALHAAQQQTGLRLEPLGELDGVVAHEESATAMMRFFAWRATGWGPHWEKHLGEDTFIIPMEQVAAQLSSPEQIRFWESHGLLTKVHPALVMVPCDWDNGRMYP